MEKSNKKIFLLRAYGDFIIAIGLINSDENLHEIEIIASSHFVDLFNAISKFLNLEKIKIKFENFQIKNGLLNFFSNKYLLRIDTLKQLKSLNTYLVKNQINKNYFLEQKNRSNILNFILNKNFNFISEGKNIYKEWVTFLGINFKLITKKKLKPNDSILILPNARLSKREIPTEIQLKLKEFCIQNNLNYKISNFSNKNDDDYSNFEELIDLIVKADFVITADSLPAHLCYILGKQHFICFPEKGKKNFFTPFVLENSYYCSFHEDIYKYFKTWI